jgi:hypothetical protein
MTITLIQQRYKQTSGFVVTPVMKIVYSLLSNVTIFTTLNFFCKLRMSQIVLHYSRLERLDRHKRSSLLGLFASYKESEAC